MGRLVTITRVIAPGSEICVKLPNGNGETTDMVEHMLLSEVGLAERSLLRGIISAADDDYRYVVHVQQRDHDWLVNAELLITSDVPLRLRPGDRVLCWVENDDRHRTLILGRLGVSPTAGSSNVTRTQEHASAAGEIPDTLVLEAKHSLTLRVGDGSITIREDGKILIKGKDLISHAQRLNRIKGGAVQIN